MGRCNFIRDKKERLMITMYLFFALVAFFGVFKVYLSYLSPHINPRISDIFKMWLNNIIVPYGIGLPILWLIVKRLPVHKVHYENMKLTKIAFFKVLILQLGFSTLLAFIIIFVMKAFGFDYTNLSINYGDKHLIFYLFLLLIFNPIVEEALFRKIILSRLLKWGEKYAILVSSMFFALPHLFSQGIPVMFSNFISGYIWAYVTVKTGKITSAILLHSISNFLGIFLPMIFPQSEIGDSLFILIRLLIIPLFAIIILIWDWNKKDFDYFKQ